MWFVYIVECQDSSLYTGVTNNLEKRLKAHNEKKGAKAIKGKLPVKLVYQESYNEKKLALSRESEIKSFKRKEKLELVKKGP
jgi:putative endonuclease